MTTNEALTFKELTKVEKQSVITAFAEAVDINSRLRDMGDSKEWTGYSTVLQALNVPNWPDSNSSPIEFAWCSAPLDQSKCPRLKTYSVFWARSFNDTANRIELWIGRSPNRPLRESDFLSDAYLVSEIIEAYGIRVSEVRKYHSISNKVWRYKWVLLNRVGVPVIITGILSMVGIMQLGLTPATFGMSITFLCTNIYASALTRRWGMSGNLFGYFVPLFFISPYIAGLTQDEVLAATIINPTSMIGLFLALTLGVILALIKAIQEDETWEDLKRTQFRSTIRLFVLICVATTTGFGIHLGHTYALDQALSKGNWIFVLLIGCGIVTYYAFLVGLLRQSENQPK